LSARNPQSTAEGKPQDSLTAEVDQRSNLHMVSATAVPPPIPPPMCLPNNIEEIAASEKARFSRRRTRDTSSAHIAAKLSQLSGVFGQGFMGSQGSQTFSLNSSSVPNDTHAGAYDCGNPASLSSVMMSTVPEPFGLVGKCPAYLNMPGGQWRQDDKYISGEIQENHELNLTRKAE